MSEDPKPLPPEASPSVPIPVAHLELKAALLLLFMLLLVCGSAVYVLYSRGVFEATQKLVLVSEDSEGVIAGMDLTFAGFPIGRVHRIELADDGKARIIIDVAAKDAHWLRQSSVFTMVKSLVGGTNIRAYSGILTDPPLPDGAVRQVLQGDAMGDVPQLMSTAKDLLENLRALTARDAALGVSLTHVQTLAEKLNGPGGALAVLMGNEADRKKLLATLDRSQALLDNATILLNRMNGLAVRADTQVFGDGGVMPEARAAMGQLNAVLTDTRASLKKVDAVLQEAQAVGANVRVATTDLGPLRADVETNLRKIEGLVNDINRKWPFARDMELKLP
jgi:phospholipid/cholesterol/gamma-HCH transport system substrate-binding protein